MTSSDVELGWIDISCKFLVNSSIALGYFAIVYAKDGDVRYLITENSDEEYVSGMLTGLNDGQYSILLYTINETGLPLEQPASFPKHVVVINSQLDNLGMYHKLIFLSN